MIVVGPPNAVPANGPFCVQMPSSVRGVDCYLTDTRGARCVNVARVFDWPDQAEQFLADVRLGQSFIAPEISNRDFNRRLKLARVVTLPPDVTGVY